MRCRYVHGGGLREIRESHVIVCVTDRCGPTSAKQAHLCGGIKKKKITEDLKTSAGSNESLFLTLDDEGW